MSYAQSIDGLNIKVTTGKLAQGIDSLDMLLSTSEGAVQDGIVLLSPANGEINVSVTPSFDWDSSTAYDAYKILIDADETFSSPIEAYVTSSDFAQTTALLSATGYFWKVVGGSVTQQDVIIPQTSGFDSEEGDILALEALAGVTSLDSDYTGWATSGMTLDPAPQGVTVESIGGENRVTAIDFKYSGITGSIDIPEWINLKKCTLVATYLNSLNSEIPQSLMDLANHSLEYLYLSQSDAVNTAIRTDYPHIAIQTGAPYIHPGKNPGNENNVFTGRLKAPSNPTTSKLKWLQLMWTDSDVELGDGISEIDPNIFSASSYEHIRLGFNGGIAKAGNTFDFPDCRHMTNLKEVNFSHANDNTDFGYLTGTVGNKLDGLVDLQTVSLSANGNLLLDFDEIDWSVSTQFWNLLTLKIRFAGTIPPYFFDGTFTRINTFIANLPQGGAKLSSQLPEFNTNGSIQIFDVAFQDVSGTIPASLWSQNQGIILADFQYNEFTSIGTDDLSNLGETGFFTLRYIKVQGNQISGRLPVLGFQSPTVNLKATTELFFGQNKYSFADLLWIPTVENPDGKPVFELYADFVTADPNGNFKGFSYLDQVVGSPSSYEVPSGDDFTINDFDQDFTHPDNSYQWQKSTDQGGSWSNIGTDSPANKNLTISSFASSDEGRYRLAVTNNTFSSIITNSALTSDLTIYSEPITLTLI